MTNKKNILLAALAAVSCVLVIEAGRAAAALPQPTFGLSGWQVNTGEVDSNFQTGAFSTPTTVRLVRPGASIQADRATGNFRTHQAVLSGNVQLHDQTGSLTNFAGNRSPSSLTCDTLQIDGTSKIYVATGRVHFSQGASWGNADRAVMNGLTHDLHLYGHVSLHQ